MSDKPEFKRIVNDLNVVLVDAVEAAPAFRAQTEEIVVIVRTFFLEDQSHPDDHRFTWAYHVRIENLRPHTVQLLNRSWHITDDRGVVIHVHGEGVAGEQPIITAGNAFEYTSSVTLQTPSGFVRGDFDMFLPGIGERFAARIPCFSLDSPYHSGSIH